MTKAKLTTNGRTTLPKEIRDSLGLKPGDLLNFTLTPNRTVLIKVINPRVTALKI